ncbi:MAG TPA: TetR/AcrR family transcriptional regulator [Anaerolineae bacterium]
MPRPRFEKLPKQKKERILEAAAREFAAHGFEGASLNQILEQAQISKGAAYYYFDDKVDLYSTVVERYSQDLLGETGPVIEQLTAETYWDTIADLYRRQFNITYEKPWIFGVVKSTRGLSEAARTHQRLAQLFQQVQSLLADLIHKGQTLGVVRTDLPADLLLPLVTAVDDVHDQWLLQHWEDVDHLQIESMVQRMVNLWRRLLEPSH